MTRTNNILDRAYALWCGAAGIRMRRERFKRFTYGDQWCDLWNNGDGKYMREDEFAKQFDTTRSPTTSCASS